MIIKRKSPVGFTLIELLVVVVIIGILAAIALPNFIGAQGKSKVAQVKSNMHTVQVASEAYATDEGGLYAAGASIIAPYYPGGANMPGGGVGTFPPNPFTPGTNDSPIDGAAIASIQAARSAGAGATSGNRGQVQYCQVSGSNNTTYGVLGMDDQGKSVAGNNGTQLVLSNQ